MIAVTPGEPAGIGPDLLVELAQAQRRVPWVVICDQHMLQARASALNLPLRIDSELQQPACAAGAVTVWHTPLAAAVTPGRLQAANAAGVIAALDRAVQGCLQSRFQALVTGPIQKSVINDSGLPFSGHTEYLAAASGVDDVVMLLVADSLRVALATTHLPLREVAEALAIDMLQRRLLIFGQGLQQWFGIRQPRILVAGLNPHAGEGGHLGDEEISVIEPVCRALRARGLDLVGPLPADTLFTPAMLEQADGVMAMYHDQGLPVLKNRGFGRAVNITLGLPFVRTSVDHGTALDLAGSGRADSGSMAEALALAAALSGADA